MTADIFSYQTHITIQRYITTLIMERKKLRDRMEAIEAEGFTNGHIVEEYRGERGPYYRLTFYTDSRGHKPRPKYLGNKPDVLARAKKKIANHHEREQLQKEISRIDETLRSARHRVEGLIQYLASQSGRVEQLVIDELMATV